MRVRELALPDTAAGNAVASCGGTRAQLGDVGVVLFVVHAFWRRDPAGGEPGTLGLWAEDSSAPLTLPRRPGRAPRVRTHPFAASQDTLVGILPASAAKAASAMVTLVLPTRGGGPVESPELVRDEIADGSGAILAGYWQVPALDFDVDLALATLRALDGQTAVFGASVTHLADVAGFATDLVARGRVLPCVADVGRRAVWRAVLTGPDAAWTRSLAQSMPPPVSAAHPDDALMVWSDALDALVDAAARAAAGVRATIAGGPATLRPGRGLRL